MSLPTCPRCERLILRKECTCKPYKIQDGRAGFVVYAYSMDDAAEIHACTTYDNEYLCDNPVEFSVNGEMYEVRATQHIEIEVSKI